MVKISIGKLLLREIFQPAKAMKHSAILNPTGYVQYAISEAKAYAAIAIAEEGMRQKAIEAFKFAVDGYFIIGGTDYSADRLNEFIKKLES